jgi:hypothetical protein
MNPSPQRADPHADTLSAMTNPVDPLELTPEQAVQSFGPELADMPAHPRGRGGRQVLAWTLTVLTILWIGYTGWAAGQALAGQSLSAPQVAQWLSIAAGPLALFGLAWLTFGRTRRREAERFTRSVVAMRHEAQSLEALLEVLWQRILESRAELTSTTQQLMQLGDDATAKLGGITREFDSSSAKLIKHGDALDRAALTARTDIAVLLEDLPRAEQTARVLTEQLRAAGSESGTRAVQLGQQVNDLAQRTR